MIDQPDLFSAASVAAFVEIPAAPALVPHTDGPYPGMTPEDSARSALANSDAYARMLAALVQSLGGHVVTDGQLKAMVPSDWRETLGDFVHGCLTLRQCDAHGIQFTHVPHEGAGFHRSYRAIG